MERYMRDIKERKERERKEKEKAGEEEVKETREERKIRRETERKKRESLKMEEAKKGEEEKEEDPFEVLRRTINVRTNLNYRSWNDLSFFHKLIKFDKAQAFSRSTFTKYAAQRNTLEDIDGRGRELREEILKIEAIKTCRLGFRHTTRDKCSMCDVRYLKNKSMWLTNVHEPKTKISSVMETHWVDTYCRQQVTKNDSTRIYMQNKILQVERKLFDQCAKYLQGKYSLHRGHMRIKRREELLEVSLEDFSDRRFEEMANDVRVGKVNTEQLYVRYADIEDKLQAYLHYHAKLRRRRLRLAGKRIWRIWKQRKKIKQLQRIEDEKVRTAKEREHKKMVAREEEMKRQAMERKGVEQMKADMRERLEKLKKANTFHCERKGCEGKCWEKRDLFDLHMKIHYNQDVKDAKAKKKKDEETKARLEREKEFMERTKERRRERRERERMEAEEVLSVTASKLRANEESVKEGNGATSKTGNDSTNTFGVEAPGSHAEETSEEGTKTTPGPPLPASHPLQHLELEDFYR